MGGLQPCLFPTGISPTSVTNSVGSALERNACRTTGSQMGLSRLGLVGWKATCYPLARCRPCSGASGSVVLINIPTDEVSIHDAPSHSLLKRGSLFIDLGSGPQNS